MGGARSKICWAMFNYQANSQPWTHPQNAMILSNHTIRYGKSIINDSRSFPNGKPPRISIAFCNWRFTTKTSAHGLVGGCGCYQWQGTLGAQFQQGRARTLTCDGKPLDNQKPAAFSEGEAVSWN